LKHKSPTNFKMFNPLLIVLQSHQKVGIHFITNVVIVLVFLSCVHICLDMPCIFCGWIFILVYTHTHGRWILGHRLGFYWVSKILVEKQFMSVRHFILMKKSRSSTCCEKCYTFWTLHWKLKNQIFLCFIAQNKQFVSLQKKTWMKYANKINFNDLFDFIMNKTVNFLKAQHNWNKKTERKA
jgi:hypothetical protein